MAFVTESRSVENNSDVKCISATSRQRRRSLINAQALYLFYYMALGSYLPFINLYFERLGLTGIQIGTLAALPVLINSSTSLFWGGIADVKHWHRRILQIALLLSPLAVFFLAQVSTMALLTPIVVVYALFSSPIVPLLDSFALEAAIENRRTYGDLRLWGSVGWAISTVLIGWLIERLGIRWLFYGYISFIGFTLFASFFHPHRQNILKSSIWTGLKNLLAHKSFLLFLFSIFMLTVTTSGVLTFFSIYMDSIGAKEGLIGLGWALSAISEVPVMILSGKVISKIGSKGLLIIAFIMFAVRWMLFSFIHIPLLALIVQLLHGPSFASFLVGSITYIHERTPEGLNTTALSIFNAVTYGLGSMAGSFLGGVLFDQVGMDILFRVFSLIATGSLIFFLTGQRFSSKMINA